MAIRRPHIFIAAGVLVVIIPMWSYYYIALPSLEAEVTHQTQYFVIQLLERHIREFHSWPRGWEDLVRVHRGGEWLGFRWPDDLEEVKKRVTIDFTLDVERVSEMSVNNFSGYKLNGPSYGLDESGIKQLITTAKGASQERES
ncbi:MAG: hypothetical protein Tsb009_33280 [Planctomycetaceae bacterium]